MICCAGSTFACAHHTTFSPTDSTIICWHVDWHEHKSGKTKKESRTRANSFFITRIRVLLMPATGLTVPMHASPYVHRCGYFFFSFIVFHARAAVQIQTRIVAINFTAFPCIRPR